MTSYLYGLVVLVGVFFGVYGLAGVLRSYALHKNIVDRPTHRSSHTADTPRGGGLSVVIVAIVCGFLSAGSEVFNYPAFLLLPLLLVAGIGVVDDIKDVSARTRMCVQALAALMVVYFFTIPALILPGVKVPSELVGLIALFAVIWSINLFNFMDGINGIASIQAILVFLCFSVLVYWEGGQTAVSAEFWLILASACAGFLVWNFPLARIFMGDGCSGFLGLLIAIGLIDLLCASQRLFVAGLIVHGVFVIDATSTLLVRLFNREKIQNAHRDHAYQKASRCFNSHTVVTLGVGAINLFWLVPWAALVALSAVSMWVGLVAAFSLPLALAYYFKAGVKSA